MSHRSTLRAALLVAVAAGAMLAPSTAAFATDNPTPTPTPSTAEPTPSTAEPTPAEVSPAPSKGVDTPDALGAMPSSAPRGGVAAGEEPAGNGSATGALYGTAGCAVLLAGAGVLVLRRRSAERNG